MAPREQNNRLVGLGHVHLFGQFIIPNWITRSPVHLPGDLAFPTHKLLFGFSWQGHHLPIFNLSTRFAVLCYCASVLRDPFALGDGSA